MDEAAGCRRRCFFRACSHRQSARRLVDGRDDRARLRIGQMRPHRQAQALVCHLLGNWESPRPQAKRRIRLLQVGWNRVMNQGANARRIQLPLQRIALRVLHHIQMPTGSAQSGTCGKARPQSAKPC